MTLRDEPAAWPVVREEVLHRDHWVLGFRADHLQRPGHPEETFRRLVVDLPGAVMVLAVDDDDRVVLLKQYRHPVGRRLVEIPAGMLDVEGEEMVVAAQRELREEAGVVADHWEHLLSVYPSPGISTEQHHIFLATGLHDTDRGGFVLEHEEAEMALERVPFSELLAAVLDGSVQDGPVVTAVLALALRRAGAQPGAAACGE